MSRLRHNYDGRAVTWHNNRIMKSCAHTLNIDSTDVLQRLWIATDEDQNQFLHIVVLKSGQTRSEPNNREVEDMDMTSQWGRD